MQLGKVKEKVIVSVVKPHLVEMIWFKVRDMLLKAVEKSNGEIDLDKVKKQFEDGSAILVVAQEDSMIMAAAMAEINEFQSGKTVLNITLAGGSDMHVWVNKFLELFDTLARHYKCEEIYVIGRPGWKRTLKEKGYEHIHTVLSKRVR